MNKKQISYFLIFLTLLIAVVIVSNYINSKPKVVKENPYQYNVDEFKKVDTSRISYKEIRQIDVEIDNEGGIATSNNLIYLAINKTVKAITLKGELQSEFKLSETPRCIAVNGQNIAVGFAKSFAVYTLKGDLLSQSKIVNDSSLFSSIAFWNNYIVVADAGKRVVYLFINNELVKTIEGVSSSGSNHGFILPSSYFDLAVNAESELWIVNPGLHSLQNYDDKGNLLNSWGVASFTIEGFCGCCNPAQYTFLPDGRFVTSEKAMPRIKIYSSVGVMESVVASTEKFTEGGKACEVATVGNTIVALDYDKKLIRIFDPISK